MCRQALVEIMLGVACIFGVDPSCCGSAREAKKIKSGINVFAFQKSKTQLLLPARRWKGVVALLSTPPGRGRDWDRLGVACVVAAMLNVVDLCTKQFKTDVAGCVCGSAQSCCGCGRSSLFV
jgi:hypothetical protein